MCHSMYTLVIIGTLGSRGSFCGTILASVDFLQYLCQSVIEKFRQ